MSVLLLSVVLPVWNPAAAGPFLPPGDSLLRHDVQLLADRGIIEGPVTSWPLAWGPLLASIRRTGQAGALPADAAASLARLQARAAWETRPDVLTYSAHAALADSPSRIRGFQNTPREDIEIAGGLSWTGARFSVTLNGQAVDESAGHSDFRADGSMIGVAVGNFTVSANTLDRWWGPGWDGSLILSNNARPIPAISIDRNFTDAFDSRWLNWIGPWDLNFTFGRLDSNRAVPDAQFFGMRFNFRPLSGLEIGLSRTAQWCGDGRPCSAGTFADLFFGRDNSGDAGIGQNNEPGNQLAGVDFRWSQGRFGLPTAVYGQFIGEDEAGGFPSRFMGQAGIEATGRLRQDRTWRWFGEVAATTCQFYESSRLYNCAYNHGIYRTGYRYRDRPIGHGADNDAVLFSTGILLFGPGENEWRALLRAGELNRGGLPDVRNTLTATPQDIASIDVSHKRSFRFGTVEIGLGHEIVDSGAGNRNDSRVFLQWRSAY